MSSEPVNVTEMKPNEVKKFLDSFDFVLSDCDGVIWSLTPFSGSGTFFELMKKHGKNVNFVSNNSMRTREQYEDKFKAAGIDNGFENLTIPSKAIVEYFQSVNMKKKIYCVSCKETVQQLKRNGFLCEYGPEKCPDDYYEFRQYMVDDEGIGAVVFDSDYKVSLPKLYRAVTYLKRPEVLFVNGASDKVVPLAPGLTALGTGVFTELVEEEVKRKSVLLGKPGIEFARFAMKRAGVGDPGRVLFIGDMIEQDIGLGKVAGFQTMLILTTFTKEAMMAHDTLRPDYYAPSLGSIVPLL